MSILVAITATVIRLLRPTRGAHNTPWNTLSEYRSVDQPSLGAPAAGTLPVGVRSARVRAYAAPVPAPVSSGSPAERVDPADPAASAEPQPALVRPYLIRAEAADERAQARAQARSQARNRAGAAAWSALANRVEAAA